MPFFSSFGGEDPWSPENIQAARRTDPVYDPSTDIDPWESQANVSAGISSVSGQSYGGRGPVQAARPSLARVATRTVAQARQEVERARAQAGAARLMDRVRDVFRRSPQASAQRSVSAIRTALRSEGRATGRLASPENTASEAVRNTRTLDDFRQSMRRTALDRPFGGFEDSAPSQVVREMLRTSGQGAEANRNRPAIADQNDWTGTGEPWQPNATALRGLNQLTLDRLNLPRELADLQALQLGDENGYWANGRGARSMVSSSYDQLRDYQQVAGHEGIAHAIEDLMSDEEWNAFDRLRRRYPYSSYEPRGDATAGDRGHTLTGYLDELALNDTPVPEEIRQFLAQIAPSIIARAQARGTFQTPEAGDAASAVRGLGSGLARFGGSLAGERAGAQSAYESLPDFAKDNVRGRRDIGQKIRDKLNTEIPGARSVQKAAGDVGEYFNPKIGRFIGESLVPTKAWEAGLELIPGVGMAPDAARLGRRALRAGSPAGGLATEGLHAGFGLNDFDDTLRNALRSDDEALAGLGRSDTARQMRGAQENARLEQRLEQSLEQVRATRRTTVPVETQEANLRAAGIDVRDTTNGHMISPAGHGVEPLSPAHGIQNHWEVAVDAGLLPSRDLVLKGRPGSRGLSANDVVDGMLKEGWIRQRDRGAFAIWDTDPETLGRLQKAIDDRDLVRDGRLYLDVRKTGESFAMPTRQFMEEAKGDVTRFLRNATKTVGEPGRPIDFSKFTQAKGLKWGDSTPLNNRADADALAKRIEANGDKVRFVTPVQRFKGRGKGAYKTFEVQVETPSGERFTVGNAAEYAARRPVKGTSEFGAGLPRGSKTVRFIERSMKQMDLQPPEPEDVAAIENFFNTRRDILSKLPNRNAKGLRLVGQAISGSEPNRFISEMVSSEDELRQMAVRLARGGTARQQEALGYEIATGFRNEMIGTLPKEQRAAVGWKLAGLDAERNAGGIASQTYDWINNALRSLVLGVDVTGVGLQQGLRAARGSPAIATGLLGRLVGATDLVYKPNIDRVAQAMADSLQMGKGGTTADIVPLAGEGGSKLRQVARLPGKALDAATTLQFEKGLGGVRLKAYEGLLLQNKILHFLSKGLLGGDITKPAVRRHIAEAANAIGSSARPAAAPRRAALEKRGLLTGRMTRAQINEITTVLRAPRSQEDMLSALNLVGGTALLFAGVNELNKEIGVGELVTDTADTMFGRMVLAAKNSKGENIVFDFLPQASLMRTMLKAVDAGINKDPRRFAEVWAQFGTGRLSLPLSDALKAAGIGYGDEGKFYSPLSDPKYIKEGDDWRMPISEALKGAAPLPIWTRGAVFEGERDPASIALSASGGNVYGESSSRAKSRVAEEMFGMPYEKLDSKQKIDAYLAMQERGEYASGEINKLRMDVWWEARDNALDSVLTAHNKGELSPTKVPAKFWEVLAKSDGDYKNFYNLLVKTIKKDGNYTLAKAEEKAGSYFDALKWDERVRNIRKQMVQKDPLIIIAVEEKGYSVADELEKAAGQ